MIQKTSALEVQFPSFRQIEADPDVRTFTDAEWAATLEGSTETQRRERGTWIFYDAELDRYTKGESMVGRWVTDPEEHAGVRLGYSPTDSLMDISPIEDSARYSAVSFHTHTPTTYFPPNHTGRFVGGSSADAAISVSMQRPAIVYDFVESTIGSGRIPTRYPKSSSARRYLSTNIIRRPIP